MSNKSKISQISVDNEAQLVIITWGDSVISEFGFDGLRRVCPCVFCRGGHEHMGKKLDPQELLRNSKRSWKVTGLRPVGNYALQFTWNDGHNTGLYQIESLRQLWDEYMQLLTPKDPWKNDRSV